MSDSSREFLLRLGSRIHQARHAREWTQLQLAEAVGVDVRSVQRIEAGRVAPALTRLLVFAEALHRTPAELLDDGPLPDVRRSSAAARDDERQDEETRALLRAWEGLPRARRKLAISIVRLLGQHRDEGR